MLDTLREISVPVEARESTPKPTTPPVAAPLAPVVTPPLAPESESIVDVREMLPEGKAMGHQEEAPTTPHWSVTGSESEATDEDMVVVDRP
jgi:hypothetical protein